MRRDADAAVAHGAGEPQQLVVQRLPLRLDRDAALLGELQRIADQVDQYLPDTRRVALDLQAAHVVGDHQLQVQTALRGAVLERLGATADQVGEVERNVLQFQL
ncbi:hypothetical protein D9M71_156140 [compost metagenome]